LTTGVRLIRSVLFAAFLLITAACGDDGGDGASPSAIGPAEEVGAEATPTGYVDALNRLCDNLAADSTDVTGGVEPAREQFLEDQPKLEALVRAFDAEAAKLEVPDEDREAAEAFRAFQRYSDAEYAKVRAAAESGDDATFKAAFEEFIADFEASKIPADLAEAGVTCPAR
jgi:hypothetical protein